MALRVAPGSWPVRIPTKSHFDPDTVASALWTYGASDSLVGPADEVPAVNSPPLTAITYCGA